MSLTIEAKVGKKYALHLPRAVVEALNLKEGGRVLLKASGKTVTVESRQDPLQLALQGKKFASITPDQVEAISKSHVFDESPKKCGYGMLEPKLPYRFNRTQI